MPAPSVASFAVEGFARASTFDPPYPAGVVAGDLLLAFAGIGDSNWPAGWVELASYGAGIINLNVAAKIADGTESGNYTVTVDSSVQAVFWTGRLIDAYLKLMPKMTGIVNGGGSSANPPSLTLPRCPPDVRWFAVVVTNSQKIVTAYPSGYDDDQLDIGSLWEFHLGVCSKATYGVNTDDPGAFTLSGHCIFQLATVGVSPLPFIQLPMSGVGP